MLEKMNEKNLPSDGTGRFQKGILVPTLSLPPLSWLYTQLGPMAEKENLKKQLASLSVPRKTASRASKDAKLSRADLTWKTSRQSMSQQGCVSPSSCPRATGSCADSAYPQSIICKMGTLRAREITDLLKSKKQVTRRGQIRIQVFPTPKPLLFLLLRRKKNTN